MSSSKDESPLPKRRESRQGIRRVSSMSTEQLERKRANDREAQRSIRQRTKEHIESLEKQVAALQAQVEELRPRSERYEELVQQNTALQDEVNRLRHQLASLTGRSSFSGSEQAGSFRSGWHLEEGPSGASTNIPSSSTMVSPITGSFYPPPNVPRAPSTVSVSSRSSHPHDWQQYMSTRSSSLGDTPEPGIPGRMEPYAIEGQVQPGSRLLPSRYPVASSQISFGSTASLSQNPSESSLTDLYARGEPPSQPPIDQPVPQLLPGQRSMPVPMPGVLATTQPNQARAYQPSAASYQNPPNQARDPSYPYTWSPQS